MKTATSVDQCVHRDDCAQTHENVNRRLHTGDINFTRIDTQLSSIINIFKLLGGGILTGIISIIVILLTKGL